MATPAHRTIHCRRCRTDFPLPELSGEVRGRIVSLVQAGNPVAAIEVLREAAGLDLRDAKAVMLHIPRKAGVCVRCSGTLAGSGPVVCEKCGGLNLHWAEER